MKRFVMAIALAFALSGIAVAGNIPTGGVASPPPPPESTALAGIIPTSDYAPPESPVVTVMLAILSIVAG